MPRGILPEDWPEYDDKKIKDGSNRNKFACEEQWERDYLVKKLKKHLPNRTEEQI